MKNNLKQYVKWALYVYLSIAGVFFAGYLLLFLVDGLVGTQPYSQRADTKSPSRLKGNEVNQDGENRILESVTFRSHLGGKIANDPVVRLGQRLRVVPDPSEPTRQHESVVVILPKLTPYEGDKRIHYLRGYAVDNLSAHNLQFM